MVDQIIRGNKGSNKVVIKEFADLYLQAAILCERVTQEKDGVLTAVRILDGVLHIPAEPFQHTVTMLLMFRSENTQGSVPIKVEIEDPSTAVVGVTQRLVNAKGQNVVLNISNAYKADGLYKFNVFIGNRMVTRVPFMVTFGKGDFMEDKFAVSDYVKGEIISHDQ